MKAKRKNSGIRLSEVIGKGYNDFWNFKGRYRVVKGSRASKKSKTTALNFIVRIMQYPQSNLLCVRKTYRTLKDSCFTELKWAIHRIGADSMFTVKESPLEITYKTTGQKILFRGLDDPLKITSITVEVGALCWLWIEEAYEINTESDFDTLDESVRGEVSPGLFKQVTLTFNPWNDRHWLKRRFFDEPSPGADGSIVYKPRVKPVSDDGDILAMTTNYKCNEWLDSSDLAVFERMKQNNPKRYRVAGLGGWGIVEGLVFENWEEKAFSIDEIRKIPGIKTAFGLDFGYTNDPTALFCCFIDMESRTIWVFDEIYKKGMSNETIAKEVKAAGYGKERIRADCAEPKSIDRLYDLGLSHIQSARKGKDSVNNGIDFIRDFRIIIHPRCVNFITEIGNYQWAVDKTGKRLNVPEDYGNHLMDAMRYALEEYSVGSAYSFK